MSKPKPDFTQEEIIQALSELLGKQETEEGYFMWELKELCDEHGLGISVEKLRRHVHQLIDEGKLISVKAIRRNVHGNPITQDVLKFVGKTERD